MIQPLGATIGIIADDLTGAADTALQFFHQGAEALIITNPDWSVTANSDHCQVFTVNTNSRHLEPDKAGKLASQNAIKLKTERSIEKFYKKMDSTLRGYFAQECLAILEALELDCAVIVPAYPEEDRRTVGGYQLLRGQPIEQTEVGRDPQFPIRQSHIPTLLEQYVDSTLVGHIQLYTVLRGAGPVLSELNQLITDGKKLVVIDACCDTDLDQITLALEKTEKTSAILPCGSAGLAKSLSKRWFNEVPQENAPRLTSGDDTKRPTLILCGSTTALSREQINALESEYDYQDKADKKLKRLNLRPEQLLNDATRLDTLTEIGALLANNQTLIISTAGNEESVGMTLEWAAHQEIPAEEINGQIQKTLGYLIIESLSKTHANLVICGGETLDTVCQSLNIEQLTISAEIEPNIPLLKINKSTENTEASSPQWLISKSGNFGHQNTLINIDKFISQSL